MGVVVGSVAVAVVLRVVVIVAVVSSGSGSSGRPECIPTDQACKKECERDIFMRSTCLVVSYLSASQSRHDLSW